MILKFSKKFQTDKCILCGQPAPLKESLSFGMRSNFRIYYPEQYDSLPNEIQSISYRYCSEECRYKGSSRDRMDALKKLLIDSGLLND